jgi:transcriptional regulator with XRE-family HTH domain/Zn-dependent peptidase ImmA (M78 family)
MSMENLLGENLARARRDRGLELTELAARSRVPVNELRALESGNSAAISTAAIARLARELGLDPDGITTASWRPVTQFKQLGAVSDFRAEDRILLEEGLLWATRLREINQALHRGFPLREAFHPIGVEGTPYLHGYSLARSVRGKIGAGPATAIDPWAILEDQLGVLVRSVGMASSRVAAVTVKDARDGTIAVLLNSRAPRANNRALIHVDLAHELAHVMFDQPSEELEVWIERELDGEPNDAGDRREQRARAFAAELLLPQDGLRTVLGPPRKQTKAPEAAELIVRTANAFGTPAELTGNHLKNHDYIAEAARSAAIDLSKKDIDVVPPASRESALVRFTRDALQQGAITAARARELLDLTVWDSGP